MDKAGHHALAKDVVVDFMIDGIERGRRLGTVRVPHQNVILGLALGSVMARSTYLEIPAHHEWSIGDFLGRVFHVRDEPGTKQGVCGCSLAGTLGRM